MEVDKYTFGIPTIDEPIHEEFFIQFRSAIIATCEDEEKKILLIVIYSLYL